MKNDTRGRQGTFHTKCERAATSKASCREARGKLGLFVSPYCTAELLCSRSRPRIEQRDWRRKRRRTGSIRTIFSTGCWCFSVVFSWWWWHSVPFWYKPQWSDCVHLIIGKASHTHTLSFSLSLSPFPFPSFPLCSGRVTPFLSFLFPSCSLSAVGYSTCAQVLMSFVFPNLGDALTVFWLYVKFC